MRRRLVSFKTQEKKMRRPNAPSKRINRKKRNKTIILVSHNLTLIRQLCDEVYVMDKGEIIYHGDPKEVVSKYESFCKN